MRFAQTALAAIMAGIALRSEPEHLARAKELSDRRKYQVCVYREHPAVSNGKGEIPVAKILHGDKVTNRPMFVCNQDEVATDYDVDLREGETMIGEYDQPRESMMPKEGGTKISYRFKGSRSAFEIWLQGNEIGAQDTVTGL